MKIRAGDLEPDYTLFCDEPIFGPGQVGNSAHIGRDSHPRMMRTLKSEGES